MSKEIQMVALSFMLLISFIVLGTLLGLFFTTAMILIIELLEELMVEYPVLALGASIGAIVGFIVWYKKVAVQML